MSQVFKSRYVCGVYCNGKPITLKNLDDIADITHRYNIGLRDVASIIFTIFDENPGKVFRLAAIKRLVKEKRSSFFTSKEVFCNTISDYIRANTSTEKVPGLFTFTKGPNGGIARNVSM